VPRYTISTVSDKSLHVHRIRRALETGEALRVDGAFGAVNKEMHTGGKNTGGDYHPHVDGRK
jgi:hypothetical protein